MSSSAQCPCSGCRSWSPAISSTGRSSPDHHQIEARPTKFRWCAILLPVQTSMANTSQDYFKELRKHVCIGRRSPDSGLHEHLDSTSFWKQAYEKSEAAQVKLLDKIYELEQFSTKEQDKWDIFELPPDPDCVSAQHTGKRKRGIEVTAKANSQSKRKCLPLKPPIPKSSHESLKQPSAGVIAEGGDGFKGISFCKH